VYSQIFVMNVLDVFLLFPGDFFCLFLQFQFFFLKNVILHLIVFFLFFFFFKIPFCNLHFPFSRFTSLGLFVKFREISFCWLLVLTHHCPVFLIFLFCNCQIVACCPSHLQLTNSNQNVLSGKSRRAFKKPILRNSSF
jgi:hypothetical protein